VILKVGAILVRAVDSTLARQRGWVSRAPGPFRVGRAAGPHPAGPGLRTTTVSAA